MVALTVIGLLVFLACIIALIVSAIRRSVGKRYWLLCMGVSLILFVIGSVNLPTTPSIPIITPSTPISTPSTPISTPSTPISTYTASEISYRDTVTDEAGRLVTATNNLGLLLENYDPGSNWKLNATSEIKTIEGIYSEALALQPPGSMLDINSQYIQALTHENNGVLLLTRFISNQDTSLMPQIIAENNAFSTGITQTATLMSDFFKLK